MSSGIYGQRAALAGRPSVGLLGSSILAGLGHPEWIARNEDEYVEIAATLAADLPRLASLRGGLREEMLASPLMDEAGFARRVEAAYRDMYRLWASSQAGDAGQIPRKAMQLELDTPAEQVPLQVTESIESRDPSAEIPGNKSDAAGEAIGEKVKVALALHQQGRLDQAEAIYKEILQSQPRHFDALQLLATVAAQKNRFPDAVELFDQALKINPDHVGSLNNRGNALCALGRADESLENYGRALRIKPDYVDALKNYGNALRELGRLHDAVDSYRRALEIQPDHAETHNNLGLTLQDLGQFDEAVASYRRALQIKLDYAEAHSNLLFAQNYHPDKTADEIVAVYRKYDERFGVPLRGAWRAHSNSRDAQRRLKVGYVSPDYRRHSTQRFLEPLLARHDKAVVEIYAYAELIRADEVTVRYQGYADHWIATAGMTDEALAERIRADGIDILLDLAGHTAKNRLLVFARKPAPVSLSWLGFGYTTGLTAVDYLLTDAESAPSGSEGLFSEQPWHLATPGYAYRPAEGMGEVNALPAQTRGHVTFGTLTRAVRINHRTIRAWSALLKRVTGARLVIDSRDFRSEAMQNALAEKFAVHGIDRGRLEIGCHSPPWDVLRGIDIGLDCFPHNSGTTLFETLYMGSPFVTLAGRPSVGRLGSAILQGLGHPEWVAASEERYVEIAAGLAADVPRLAALRAGLRGAMQASALMDEAGFARKVEAAYRAMFSRWAGGSEAQTAPTNQALTQTDLNQLVFFFNAKRYAEMETLACSLVDRLPDVGAAWKALGTSLQVQGKPALPALQNAAQLLPDDAEVQNNLGAAWRKIGQLNEAATSYRRALAIQPNRGKTHYSLGNVLIDLGQFDAAVASYHRALEIQPDYVDAHSNLLFVQNYHPDKSAEEIFSAYREYEERFGAPLRASWRPHGNSRETSRRLMVGYVSPDFRNHSTRYYLEPLMAHHDKTAVEIYAYAELNRTDKVTARYQGYADHWIPTAGMTDEALAERIRADGIDILVDLAGHTAKNRLLVFARKPAPVSLSWLGFGYTTGLSAVDYLLMDAECAPRGSEGLFSEQPWHLATPGYVYRPAESMGPVNPLPALTRGYVTFGTLTRAVRINHRTIRAWSALLKRVTGARLVIDSRDFRSEAMKSALAEKFAAHGIERERLEIGCHSPPWDVLRGIDIGLDCFPHNSGTTLFETLYLGVPFVTLAGRPSVGRLGSSVLAGLGHSEWIARSEDEYVEIAAILAADLPRLAALRAGLRGEMLASPLMDEAGFARKVEAAFREMFGRWARG